MMRLSKVVYLTNAVTFTTYATPENSVTFTITVCMLSSSCSIMLTFDRPTMVGSGVTAFSQDKQLKLPRGNRCRNLRWLCASLVLAPSQRIRFLFLLWYDADWLYRYFLIDTTYVLLARLQN